MITAVDTNILLDLLIPGEAHAGLAEQALTHAIRGGALVISEPVYAELAVSFPDPGALDRFLADAGIRLDSSHADSLYGAGMAWREYVRRRPVLTTCASCGNQQDVRCDRYGASLQRRQHVLADFIIGAHALMQADRLLTRDRRVYGTYFPRLVLSVGPPAALASALEITDEHR